jgi:hypothetical protein
MDRERCSSGITPYDKVIDDLRLGDNVVWHADRLEEYVHVARRFAAQAVTDGRQLYYLRFAAHAPILTETDGVMVITLDATAGFEAFTSQVHRVIAQAGLKAFYVFDSLSELQEAWATDLMVGNFFAVTCPYLFELDTIAYFCLIRGVHAAEAIARIRETTQLFLNLLRGAEGPVFQPVKVWHRYSPTMFLPHVFRHQGLVPVTDGLYHGWSFTRPIAASMDFWDRLFLEAENAMTAQAEPGELAAWRHRLSRLLLGRDERMLALADTWLGLGDLLEIRHRMIGTGYIGGKAVGMLIARKVAAGLHAEGLLSIDLQSDSLYVGSDVFQTYLIHNGLWRSHMRQQFGEGYYELADDLHAGMLRGTFPPFVREQFQQALDMFGQMPVIVRSSSLLEDGYGNAFAGKYQSVFCVNQGDPEARLAVFEDAIRQVYASTVDLPALVYRRERGLDRVGEQMSILVQRVSGAMHGSCHFPIAAGVGLSYSAYTWHPEMDPAKGMMRIVAGLGTRAVDRVEGDHTRIVSLDMPELPPFTGNERTNGQRMVDLLDVTGNRLKTVPLLKAAAMLPAREAGMVFGQDPQARERAVAAGLDPALALVADFHGLFDGSAFLRVMRQTLAALEAAYENPVDVEFTVNLYEGMPHLTLVQCRPLQTFLLGEGTLPTQVADSERLFALSGGSFLGGGTPDLLLNTVVAIDPAGYAGLPMVRRHEVARTIGRINERLRALGRRAMLVVPGRCGTTTPSLGVPVRFSEISGFLCICEREHAASGMVPELSFGSHFFQDLVESRIFYAALMAHTPLNEALLLREPNSLCEILPAAEEWGDIIRVSQFDPPLRLAASPKEQRAVCWLPAADATPV